MNERRLNSLKAMTLPSLPRSHVQLDLLPETLFPLSCVGGDKKKWSSTEMIGSSTEIKREIIECRKPKSGQAHFESFNSLGNAW